jgi:hypothetical protein
MSVADVCWIARNVDARAESGILLALLGGAPARERDG